MLNEAANLGTWLKERRKALRLTQEEVADLAGCSRDAVSKIEQGNRRPSMQLAEILAAVLKVPDEEREDFIYLAREEPPAYSAGKTRSTNLPTSLTSFVGRDQERQLLQQYLMRDQVRLLTLVGPPGTGKTRLALEVARHTLGIFTDGVFFVDLAPISDPALVVPTIAQTLTVKERGDKPLIEVLKSFLNSKQVLLLLDNFEQVLEAGNAVLDLLTGTSRLKVLVTSRIRLQARGEHVFPVPPLDLPPPASARDGHFPVERLVEYDATRLFIERAQSAEAGFVVNNENAPMIAQICHRLDGLPLAIELAAARINVVSPTAMLARLSGSLSLLSGGLRDLPTRHHTLRRAIEWSYELLSEEEKRLFRYTSVFIGGFSLEAVEAVYTLLCQPHVNCFEGLSTLTNSSLLRRVIGVGDQPRFAMLETIHEYARERLEESGEGEALGREHAIYYMKMAEETGSQFIWGIGPRVIEWLSRLETEHDNIRAALRWTRENNDVEIGLRLAGAIWQFWIIHGYFSEGREQLTRLLALEGISTKVTTPNVTAATRALALTGAGLLAWHQGDYVSTRLLFEQSLAMWQELGDRSGMAFSLLNLGRVAQSQRELDAARSLFDRSLSICRELGNKMGIALALQALGNVAFMEGDYPGARSLHEESLALFREVGGRRGSGFELFMLGQVARREGDNKRARESYVQSLIIGQELGDGRMIAGFLLGFGGVAAASGQPERGARLYGASEAVYDAIGAVLDPEDQMEYDRDLSVIRSQLGEHVFAQAWDEGRAMSMDQAIEYALEVS